MAERKNMTLQALRALARKVLGSGYSRLKKQELARAIEAAQRKQGAPSRSPARPIKAGKAGKPAPAVPAARASTPAKAPPSPKPSPAAKVRAAGKAVRRAAAAVGAKAGLVASGAGKVAERAGKAAASASGKAAGVARKARAMARGMAARPASRARPGDQPDPESYFVARVRGEEAVREAPHPMTEAAVEAKRGARRRSPAEPVEAWDEQLGELPWSYGDDLLIALPRDPRTLFLTWDHAADTLKRGWEGLDHGKAELWVFAQQPDGGWERVRALELTLEARGWYVHDLDPGRLYRAEIHLVDRKRDKLLPQASNPVLLPPVGPSPVVDDRFARIPWGEQIARWLAVETAGAPFAEELRAQLARLSDWSRFGGGTWGAAAGGMGGRPSSPASAPGGPGGADRPTSPSPSSPWGGGR